MLCICPLDHWVPISLCRSICPVWRPCLWVVSLGSKSCCLRVPWPRPHCPVPMVPIVTMLGFVECFGFDIVTLSHNKKDPDFSKKKCGTFLARVPRLGSTLSARSNACSKKPTVSGCENSSVSLSLSDSESLRLPLVAVYSSSSAASSTSEASRLSVVSWVFTLSASRNYSFIAVDMPCSSLLPSSWWPSSGCQIPSCSDPSSSISGVSVLSGIEPTSDSLMITSRTAITLLVLGTYTRYPLSPSV